MELRDFAEEILFATTLEEKLRAPEAITDVRPGTTIVAPATPGRPPELRFKSSRSRKADVPDTHRLEQQSERGGLLHFFADHELLATELMALVLLRFPDAPPAFRRGVLQTLQDEQEHTRLYLERMKSCGMAFGQLPVSGYFWRAISGMENPMDFVASLSLTFEQANLDFARHFARVFAAVGDAESARLLEKIHRDEIAHVASGLKWFRRWKNPDQSDWEAFCRQLKFPLSPQRAKGPRLDVEGRRAAGLDSNFIEALNVFSQSKGRTPGVFVFNPLAEGYVAQGRSFTPAKPQAQLARDLANLPQFLCRQDDIVLVERCPSVQFLSAIKNAGFALPEFVELECRRPLTPAHTPPRPPGGGGGVPEGGGRGQPPISGIASLTQRKLGRLRPWAWGPDSLELLGPLFANVSGEHRVANECFNEAIGQLYSKAWSAAFLEKVLSRLRGADESWLCTEHEVGVAVTTLPDALEAIAAVRGRGHHKVVVKEALGLAGRNAIRLWEPELLGVHRRWMARALDHGRQLVIEPWLEREIDFSVQLEMTPRGLRLFGYTSLFNDRKGQFQANRAASSHDRRIPAPVTTLFLQPSDIALRIHRFYVDLFSLLETALKRTGYLAPVGIDPLVYRSAQGEPRLKPVVEINPRHTMGRLTRELMRRAAPGRHGRLRLVNRAQLSAEGFTDFPGYAAHLEKQFPLQLEGEPIPRISQGALCLNDPAQA